jgi:HPt (histidine-containing phosphotransfer) domain-containing protein
MRRALFEGDAAAAEREAHSLKGAAATLGAAALAEAAATAEVAIRTGQRVEEALAALSRALDPVIQGITAGLPEEAPGNGKAAGSGDPARVAAPLARLKQLLENDDGEAADFIIDAKSRLVGVLTPTEVKTLSDKVGNFDFDAALKCLSGIAARLSLDLESK